MKSVKSEIVGTVAKDISDDEYFIILYKSEEMIPLKILDDLRDDIVWFMEFKVGGFRMIEWEKGGFTNTSDPLREY